MYGGGACDRGEVPRRCARRTDGIRGTRGTRCGVPAGVANRAQLVAAVSAIGVASGDLEIDGRTYHFSRGFDGYCRTEQGASMSQGFLKTLPKGWTKQRLELSATGVSKADPGEAELAEHGLARKVKDVWLER